MIGLQIEQIARISRRSRPPETVVVSFVYADDSDTADGITIIAVIIMDRSRRVRQANFNTPCHHMWGAYTKGVPSRYVLKPRDGGPPHGTTAPHRTAPHRTAPHFNDSAE
jgi:hypothetical protein